jgi:PhnB protein
MPQLTAYLGFDGNCAEAMRFYERALNGKLTRLMKVSETPVAGQAGPENADRIMHARLEFDGAVLMAGDNLVGMGNYEPMKGFNVTVSYASADEARPVFEALSEGAKQIIMPFAPAFWADASGMLIDRFGTPWIINGNVTA